jgi:hypothetical protein
MAISGRSIAAIDYFNDDSIVHTWTYNLDRVAYSNFKITELER